MPSDLRILHLADSHIGADLPKRRGGVRPRRGNDFVESYQRVLKQAARLDVDLVIHAGDLFDEPRPGDGALAAAAGPVWELAGSGVPVVIVPGNHERCAIPPSLLLSHPNIHILHEPRTVRLARRGLSVAVAGFPCIRRDAARRFAEQLRETRWPAASADVNILAVHQAFVGARCGPGNFLFRAGDDVVSTEAVPREFQYVAAGHVHRYQMLAPSAADGPPIVYSGSPDRITFAEMGEPKGSVLVEFSGRGVKPRFLEHDVRAMVLLAIDLTGLTSQAILDRSLEAVREVPRGAIVALRLTGEASGKSVSGLRLTQSLRAARPDLLLTVSTQAVEWRSPPGAIRDSRAHLRSVFDALDAPATPITSVNVAGVGTLPATCGTYALHDSDGRLLYVGKAVNLRSRVRSHQRGASANRYFAGWWGQIARIDVRPAASELEALLVEAELIRRWRPPFNRQMRLWERYCYLCETNRPYGQLQVTREPISGRFCFGPLSSRSRAQAALDALSAHFGLALCPPESGPRPPRSGSLLGTARLCERYFVGACTGPCADRIRAEDYAERLAARRAFLNGEAVVEADGLRAELNRLTTADEGEQTGTRQQRVRLLRELTALHAIAVELREARALLGQPIALPAEREECRMDAYISRDGLKLAKVACGRASLIRDAADQPSLQRSPAGSGGALPKCVADCLRVAVRNLRRHARSEVSPCVDDRGSRRARL